MPWKPRQPWRFQFPAKSPSWAVGVMQFNICQFVRENPRSMHAIYSTVRPSSSVVVRLPMSYKRRSLLVYDGPNTLCESSSLPSRPRFRIWPAFGAASRGVAASALRRASWRFFTRACYGMSVCGSNNNTEYCMITHLLLVVQTLVVVLQERGALLPARAVLAVRVDHVAGQHFLPEGKAPAGACIVRLLASCFSGSNCCRLSSFPAIRVPASIKRTSV